MLGQPAKVRPPALAQPVRTPAWRIVYQPLGGGEAVEISRELAPMVLSVSYTDKLHGESDEIDLRIEDRDGRWRTDWWPGRGDRVTLEIGYAGAAMLPCGDFRIDEIELSGPPDVLSVKAMAAAVTQPLRTARHRAFEGQSLAAIAGAIAAEHGLRVIGDLPGLTVQRVSQSGQDDLAFLKRLAEEHGFVFNVRGDSLVVYPLGELEQAPPVATLRRQDLGQYQLKQTTDQQYRACEVSYQDPVSGQTISARAEAPPPDGAAEARGDVLRRRLRCETAAQAQARARALLDRTNGQEISGTLRLDGDPRLVAGVTVGLQGMGRLDGRYLVERSTHFLDRGQGYRTDLAVRRAGVATGDEEEEEEGTEDV